MPDQTISWADFTQPAAGAGKPAPGDPGYTGYAGGSKESGDEERMRYLQAEANNPKLSAEDRQAVGREIDRMPNASQPKGEISWSDFAKAPPTLPAKPMASAPTFFQKLAGSGLTGLRDVATLGDMGINFLTNGIPAYLADLNRRGQGIAEGENHEVTSRAARDISDRINETAPNILQKLVAMIPNPDPGSPAGNENHVASAMDTLTHLTDTEARELSYHTGPLIGEDDWKDLRDTLLMGFGLRGTELGAGELAVKLTKQKEGVSTADQLQEPTPEKENPKEQPAKPASQKQLRALKAQVRTRYTNDADYAKAFSQRARQQARFAQATANMAQRVSERANLPREEKTPTILTPEVKVDTSVVGQRSLDTGLRKINSKQAFLLTPEEKIAIRGNAKSWGGLIEKGAADPDLLAAMAIGGVGTALALAYPDKAKEAFDNLGLLGGLFFTGSIEKIAAHSDSVPLSVLRNDSDNSWLTIDRLPQNASVLKKSQIEEQLRRPDVTKAEKEIVHSILDQHVGGTITPKQLVLGMKEATGDFKLTKRDTKEYANFGLGNLRENSTLEKLDADYPNSTHLWVLPEHMMLDLRGGHFDHPTYFGHTRVFFDDGLRHVMEVQSDLTQNLGKGLSPSELQRALEEEYPLPETKKAVRDTAIRSQIGPMVKDSYKRLIREELADAARSGESVVRFATEDTVRKVEGWDQSENEAGILPAGIQSILDRYEGPIARFLKGLGAVRVRDNPEDNLSATWWEVPTKPLGTRAQMFGRSTPEVLSGLAGAGLGMAIGAKLDPNNPIEGAVLGVLGAAFIRGGAIPAMRKVASEIAKPDTRIRITNLTNSLAYRVAAGSRVAWQASERMVRLVPDAERRAAITRAIDEGRTGELKGNEAKLADYQHEVMEEALRLGRQYGVLDAAVEDYVTHFWKSGGKGEAVLKTFSRGMSPSTRFSKARSFTTLAQGKAAGFTPLTEDVATITDMYLNSVYRAIANRRFIDDLHQAKTDSGFPLVMKGKKAPASYVSINNPLLQNYKVNPDIAPSLAFLFEQQAPGKFMTALGAVNTAIKRNAVSVSLFHAKSLMDAAIGATANPITVAKVMAQTSAPRVFGENRFLKMAREGGAGDLADNAQRDGLIFSFERREPSVEDVTGSFYKGMRWLQDSLDRTIPGAGLPVKGITALNHHIDNFMWGRLHAAFKLEIYAAKREALMRNTAKIGKGLSEEKAGAIAAEYANNIFGGLNWQRIAEDASTKWGRDFSLEAFSPRGRRLTQLAVFAPDWTLSTTRALVQARPKSLRAIEGAKGLLSPKNLGDLHRQQFIRSALWYVTVGDGINYAMTGHHLWENKNWLRVDLGDGLSMQLSKHFTEPFEWLVQPRQEVLNKLAYLPSEALEQTEGVQWLSASGKAPRIDPTIKGRAEHAARAMLPFSASSFVGGHGSPRAAISSTLGVPIYGQTPQERRQARLEAALKKYNEQYGGS